MDIFIWAFLYEHRYMSIIIWSFYMRIFIWACFIWVFVDEHLYMCIFIWALSYDHCLYEQYYNGNIAYSQFQYIINELNHTPNCSEIRNLFEILRISMPEIENLIQSHCHTAKKTKIAEKHLRNQSKKAKLDIIYQDQFHPVSPGHNRYLVSTQAINGHS